MEQLAYQNSSSKHYYSHQRRGWGKNHCRYIVIVNFGRDRSKSQQDRFQNIVAHIPITDWNILGISANWTQHIHCHVTTNSYAFNIEALRQWLLHFNDIPNESLANAKVSTQQPWYIGCNTLNRPHLGSPSNINIIYTPFWDTATYWQKIAYFSHPSLIRHPHSLCSLWNFAAKLSVRKLESWGYSMVKVAWS